MNQKKQDNQPADASSAPSPLPQTVKAAAGPSITTSPEKRTTTTTISSPVKLTTLPPPSPANKENREKGEVKETEEEEEEDERLEGLEDDQDEEMEDEVLPLSNAALVSLPLARTLSADPSCPQSASPVSRKTRLSALAQSINSWEDDLGTPNKQGAVVPAQVNALKAPRYSVSTPPNTSNKMANQAKRNSCHQFVATAPAATNSNKGSPLSPSVRMPPSPTK